jgi:hypothetical protein
MAKGARGLTFGGLLVGDHLVKSEWNLVIQVASMNEEPMTAQREDANPRRAVCGESRMHGSEGGVGKHSSAVRPAPTLQQATRWLRRGGARRANISSLRLWEAGRTSPAAAQTCALTGAVGAFGIAAFRH